MNESAGQAAGLTSVPQTVQWTKKWRKDLDMVLQEIKGSGDNTMPGGDGRSSRERSLCITKIQEAVMWLGMDLKAQKEEGISDAPNPYPESYNAASPQIEPTADGLKL